MASIIPASATGQQQRFPKHCQWDRGSSAVTKNNIEGAGIRTEITSWGGLVERRKLSRTDLFLCMRKDVPEFQDR